MENERFPQAKDWQRSHEVCHSLSLISWVDIKIGVNLFETSVSFSVLKWDMVGLQGFIGVRLYSTVLLEAVLD